jgi:hypothetical protein
MFATIAARGCYGLVNNKDPDAHGLKGELFLLQAQTSSSKQAAVEAHSLLQEAIRLNPKLSHKYASSLQQAKEIAKL